MRLLVVLASLAGCTLLFGDRLESPDAGSCGRLTCADVGADCGTISDGCGGTVECGGCADGQSCGGGGLNRCGDQPCLPKSCDELGANCGQISDGCGAILDCGHCVAPAMCGFGGKANQCGACRPTSCAAQNANCGQIPDGCGELLDCGGCPAGDSCGAGGPNRCATTKCPDCQTLGLFCGSVMDSCSGKLLECGQCSLPETCGGGDDPARCGCTPSSCTVLGAKCGSIDDGCGHSLNCGTCTSGSCVNHKCVVDPCANGAKDGKETGIDCGGGTCPACALGKSCKLDSDCASNSCDFMTLMCVPGWKQVASLSSARFFLGAATGSDGRIYAVGGLDAGSLPVATVEAYTPSTNSWQTVAPLPTARGGLAVVAGPDGRIYAIGGQAVVGGKSAIVATVEVYTPSTNSWATAAPLLTARTEHAAALGPDGRIYVMGGYIAGDTTHGILSAEAYTPSTNSWMGLPNLGYPRFDLAAATANGKVFAMGGGNGAFTSDVNEAFTPGGTAWQNNLTGPGPRGPFAAVTGQDGFIYAVGGVTDPNVVSDFNRYDAKSNTWTFLSGLKMDRRTLAAAVAPDGRIYAIGGGSEVDVYTP